MCIKYGLCNNLLERLKSLEDTDLDPFEGIPEIEDNLEDVPGLAIGPDSSNKDENGIIV